MFSLSITPNIKESKRDIERDGEVKETLKRDRERGRVKKERDTE